MSYLLDESIQSSDGESTLALYLWQTLHPRGIVQISHGMREHMGRYDNFARYLSNHGYIVCGHDHLGHGRTAGDGVYGHIAKRHGARTLVRDCYLVTRWITNRHPGLPVFFLGHSMGSLIGRLYVLRYADMLAGFICMGTSGERLYMPFARAVAELAARVCGDNSQSHLIHNMLRQNTLRRLAAGAGESDWLSRDESVPRAFDDDEHTKAKFTNRGYCDLFDLHIAATSARWASLVDKTLPMFLLSGEDDPIGDFGCGVVQVFDRLKIAGLLDVRCRMYEGARHELLNELNREEVYYDILCWMNDRADL